MGGRVHGTWRPLTVFSLRAHRVHGGRRGSGGSRPVAVPRVRPGAELLPRGGTGASPRAGCGRTPHQLLLPGHVTARLGRPQVKHQQQQRFSVYNGYPSNHTPSFLVYLQ